jgi:hypothetical protein
MSDIIPFHEADFGQTALRKYTHLREAEFRDGRYISAGLCDDGGWSIRIERDTVDGKRSRLDFGLSQDAGLVLLRCMVNVLSDRDNANIDRTADKGCSVEGMVDQNSEAKS